MPELTRCLDASGLTACTAAGKLPILMFAPPQADHLAAEGSGASSRADEIGLLLWRDVGDVRLKKDTFVLSATNAWVGGKVAARARMRAAD